MLKKEKKIQNNARPSLTKRAGTTAVLALTVFGGISVTSGTAQAAEPVQQAYSPVQTSFQPSPEFIDFRDIIRRARERRERIARERCERRPGRHRFVRGRCIPVFGGRFGRFDNDHDDGDRRGDGRFGRFGDHDGDRNGRR